MMIILGMNFFTDLPNTNLMLVYLAGLGAGAVAFGIGYVAAD